MKCAFFTLSKKKLVKVLLLCFSLLLDSFIFHLQLHFSFFSCWLNLLLVATPFVIELFTSNRGFLPAAQVKNHRFLFIALFPSLTSVNRCNRRAHSDDLCHSEVNVLETSRSSLPQRNQRLTSVIFTIQPHLEQWIFASACGIDVCKAEQSAIIPIVQFWIRAVNKLRLVHSGLD
jgi:hypothetical protein